MKRNEMKQKYLLFAGAWVACMTVMAQTPYMNENYMSTDLIGSARYVGMGGALGALGADISAGSANPAALGLYRRSDAALSFSVLTQGEKPDLNADMTHMSFDQMGFVVSVPIMGKAVKFVNLGVNYQKRANFNSAFIADNKKLNGLSQTQQIANLVGYEPIPPLVDLMVNEKFGAWLVNPFYQYNNNGEIIKDNSGNPIYTYAGMKSDWNEYDRVTEGGISGYDFNLSMNIKDHVYLGFTLGVNDVDYYSYSTYREFGALTSGDGSPISGIPKYDYYLYNTQHVRGYGVNVKLGAILRPIENSPFRIGLTVETPTFYHLKSSSTYSINSLALDADENSKIIPVMENGDYVYADYVPDYDLASLHLKINTPWKVRVSLGHTIGKYMALGAEYEYANYGKTKQGYDDVDYDAWGYSYGSTVHDPDMDAMHKSTLRGSHSFKFGMEMNLTDQIAFRLGYNYYSSMFRKNATLDQTGESPAFSYQTTTDYMNKGDVNIFTAGLGWHSRHFYADVAYKYRMQSGDFYAFDDTYLDGQLTPIDVKLDTHQVFFSIGYKF